MVITSLFATVCPSPPAWSMHVPVREFTITKRPHSLRVQGLIRKTRGVHENISSHLAEFTALTRHLSLTAVMWAFLSFPFLASAEAMIITQPLDELVSTSEYIVIADVARSDDVGHEILPGGFRIIRLRNELTLVEALKGPWPSEAPIVMETVKPEKGWMEDNVELPPPGSRVLLFLIRSKDGAINPVNGIQGVWPLKDGKPLQMGLRYSVDQVRDLVKKQHADIPSKGVTP